MVLLLVFFLLAANPYDVVIQNGRIIDVTGSPWYSGDIGIRQGRIASIGNLKDAPAKRTIDAHGMVVAPGFIDMLGQSELTILVNPHLPSKIYQGITTEITGEGGSIAPVNEAILKADQVGYEHYGIRPDWRTFRDYFARLEKQGMGINLASYVGATEVRRMVLGDDDRAPNAAELERMKALVREAMRDGAVGVSSALQYAPAPYATTEELIALAAEAGKYGGIYATHMRSEGDAIVPALDEAIRIGREARIPVEIWHLKTAGKANWGRMAEVIAHIQQARDAGVDITADTYASPAGFNTFSAIIPPWAHDGGDAKLIERLKDPATRARIRKEMETPGGKLGERVAGGHRAGILPDRRGTEPEAAAIAGQDPRGDCQALGQRSVRHHLRPADRRPGLHQRGDLHDVGTGHHEDRHVGVGFNLQRFGRDRAGWAAGEGAPASARLRDVPTHPAQVRAGGKEADAPGCHSQVQG